MAPRGGYRPTAGRPSGKGPYGESTRVMRIPVSRVESVKKLIQSVPQRIPLYCSKVPAGFPSPADDFIESHLDLNDFLIQHPAATFMVRAVGDSMINAGIFSDDILIVDRSITPESGMVIIAAIDGELTVKRLQLTADSMVLQAENPDYPNISISKEQETVIWGVVTNVIHKV